MPNNKIVPMVYVRMERPEDITAVRIVNQQAFGQPAEANIVDALRLRCPQALSLVAEEEHRIVGHILFTPVEIDHGHGAIRGMGLAPMAVAPDCQGRGIGSRLVEHGLGLLQARSCPFVIVLGHPTYYPRFGFVPASRCNIACQWEGVPDEVFMIKVFDSNVLAGVAGVARYRDEFDQAM